MRRGAWTLSFLIGLLAASAWAGGSNKVFLIGNSLTWDTVPSALDGEVRWHVDCGKSLRFIHTNPAAPCVRSSTLWPAALTNDQYDIVVVQPHYRTTVAEDAEVIGRWMAMQPGADFVLHTGWAFSETRAEEWGREDDGAMRHSPAYFDALLAALRGAWPDREIRRTRAMDLLQRVAADAEAGLAPVNDVAELYRDKIHMNVVTGRYLVHNAMRHALGQPFSGRGFEKLSPEMKRYLDRVLATLE